jgi:hypothetical protein
MSWQGYLLCGSSIEAMLHVWRVSTKTACNRARCSCSIWLPALRQAAHHPAAPKCHMPSSSWPPVLRQSAHRRAASKCHAPLPTGLPVRRRSAHESVVPTLISVRQNHFKSEQHRLAQCKGLHVKARFFPSAARKGLTVGACPAFVDTRT